MCGQLEAISVSSLFENSSSALRATTNRPKECQGSSQFVFRRLVFEQRLLDIAGPSQVATDPAGRNSVAKNAENTDLPCKESYRSMESFVCLVGGSLLAIVGIALFKLRPPNWQNDGELSEHEGRAIRRWYWVQRVVRFCNNIVIVAIGVQIAATSFIPHGRAWMAVWSVILLLLLLCIFLAMVDAMGSLAGYRRALPEAARRSFTDRELAIQQQLADSSPSAAENDRS